MEKEESMVNEKMIEKLDLLPPEYQQQVDNYIDFILEQINIMPPERKYRESGQLKGKVWMSPDFDAPLEDFKDYM
ncbi:MAG TPA: DUF2281 domain-containing protein [Parafilimonas sp.]|nr:DUF2281 domain-containing protein [Parafilimonas sp.]